MAWTPKDAARQDDKIFVITGGNSGIGFEAAVILAGLGGEVVLACRNLEKGQKALTTLQERVPDAKASLLQLDLADLDSVRTAAKELQERYKRIDVLINNAGVMALPYCKTKDGFEMQIGTNHLGHFVWTGLLIDDIADRVVNVSSIFHRRGTINFDDLMSEKKYDKWAAYGQSKLANMLFTFELQRRLQARTRDVRSIACHPGYSATNLQMVGPDMTGSGFQRFIMNLGNSLLAQSAEQGSWPTVYAAIGDVPSGSYVGPNGFMESRGKAHISNKISKRAKSVEDAKRFWKVSQELTGFSFLDD